MRSFHLPQEVSSNIDLVINIISFILSKCSLFSIKSNKQMYLFKNKSLNSSYHARAGLVGSAEIVLSVYLYLHVSAYVYTFLVLTGFYF